MPYNPYTHRRRSVRLKGYDYSLAGMYFVTVCVKNRRCLFGNITNGEMVLNEYGKIAYDELAKTADVRSNVRLDVFVVMPNHIHCIIVITNTPSNGTTASTRRGVLHTPRDVHAPNNNNDTNVHAGAFHDNNNIDVRNDRGVCNTPLRSPSNTVGAIVRGYKSAVTKQLKQLGIFEHVWQRNYHEHIIRNELSYQRIADYIVNNSMDWENDIFYI